MREDGWVDKVTPAASEPVVSTRPPVLLFQAEIGIDGQILRVQMTKLDCQKRVVHKEIAELTVYHKIELPSRREDSYQGEGTLDNP
jgi:hypothetical protein